MRAARLMLEAYKTLLQAADSMRSSKLQEGESFRHLLESLKQLSQAITVMRALGQLDPESEREWEEIVAGQ